jgi:hypothetical protein
LDRDENAAMNIRNEAVQFYEDTPAWGGIEASGERSSIKTASMKRGKLIASLAVNLTLGINIKLSPKGEGH